MGAITATQNLDAHGLFKVFTFSDVDDEETFVVGTAYPVKAWWYQAQGNPATQTKAGANVTFTPLTGTFTFYPGEDNQGGQLFIVQSGL